MKKSLITATLLATALYSQSINIHNGWQLLGATEDLNTTAFDNSGCVDYLWKYDATNSASPWSVHISNGMNYNGSLATFNQIKKGSGFWVKGNSNCSFTIVEQYLNTSLIQYLAEVKITHDGDPGEYYTYIYHKDGTVNFQMHDKDGDGTGTATWKIDKNDPETIIITYANKDIDRVTFGNIEVDTEIKDQYINHSNSSNIDISHPKIIKIGLTNEYLKGKTLYGVYSGEKHYSTYDFSASNANKTFIDENTNDTDYGKTLTGYHTGDGMIRVVDGELWEYTTDNNGNYNDGINKFKIVSIDAKKITTTMIEPGTTNKWTVNFYFNKNDADTSISTH